MASAHSRPPADRQPGRQRWRRGLFAARGRHCCRSSSGSLTGAAILQAGGDEDEALLSYGLIGQLQPGTVTEPGTDPMAVRAWLLDLLDRRQADGQVVVLAVDDLQWAEPPSSRAVLFALRRLP